MAILRMIAVLFAALFALAFRPDDSGASGSGSGASGDGNNDGGSDGNDGDGKPDDPDAGFFKVLRFKTEQALNEHYNRVFKSRHKRMREQIRGELEDEIREEVRAERDSSDEEARKVAERRRNRITELEGQIETLESERDAANERVTEIEGERDRYSGVIEQRWNAIKKRIPKRDLELLEDRDVLFKLSWVEKHPDALLPEEPTEPTDDGDGSGATQNGSGATQNGSVAGSAGGGSPIVGSPETRRDGKPRSGQEKEDEAALTETQRRTTFSL